MEPLMVPLYLAVLERAKLGSEARLLDVGCGAGGFLRLAVATGIGAAAELKGIDAAEGLIAIARERARAAEFQVADLEDLPFRDATFDVVTSFNAVQFAASPAAALREAHRVIKQGGKFCVATWGRAQECEAAAYLDAVAALLPARARAGGPGPFALSEPGVLEHLLAGAGLTAIAAGEVDVPWRFKNLDAALRALLSTGPSVRAIRAVGEPRVRHAVAEAISPFRTSGGEYRLENRFRFLIARRVVAMYTTYFQRS
jgi:SAM-dependent methyltransferase